MKSCVLESSDNVGYIHREKNIRKKRRRRKRKTIRTLYVSGLPPDAKPREVYLMFCTFTGYQGSILLMRTMEKKPFPVAFVTFESREHAKAAEIALHGKRFDPASTSTMYIEFAKEDTKRDTHADIIPASLSIQRNKHTSQQELVSTDYVVRDINSICTQGNIRHWDNNNNNNNNQSFSQPLYMGLPSNYLGMIPTKSLSQQPLSHNNRIQVTNYTDRHQQESVQIC